MKNVKLFFNRQKMSLLACYLYFKDYIDHIKYSVSYHSFRNGSKDMRRCTIMLLNHQLEKAQTYVTLRNDYGKEKIKSLLNCIQIYISEYGYDSLIYTSLGVIDSHLKNSFSYKDENIIVKYNTIVDNMEDKSSLQKGLGGILRYNKSDIPQIVGLYDFLNARHSCRIYSEEEISSEDIDLAIKYAITAPSACNRQSVRAHYYNSKEVIEQIVKAQKADIDWCLKAKGLFIITANRSYFRNYYERNQRMFDAGLFSMNLVIGLHKLKIGSCFKMAQKTASIDKTTKLIAGISEVEDICVLLMIGKYPQEDIIYAKSSRLDVSDILEIHV